MAAPKLNRFSFKKISSEKVDEKVQKDATADTQKLKQEIEMIKKALQEKLKSPELAKKAALIISEMLKENPKK